MLTSSLSFYADHYLSAFEIFNHFRGETNDAEENFEIPQKPRQQTGSGGLIQTELATGAQWIFAGGDLIFPPRSWPWTILREAGFVVRGQTKHLNQDMAQIHNSSETGPIGYLAGACFLNQLGSAASASMAKQGLKQLSIDAFRRDYRTLLDQHYLAGQFAARLAATLGNLNDSQLNTFLKPMDANLAECLRNCAQRVRAAPKDQPLAKTIAPALDTYWRSALKQGVAIQLNKFAGG